MSVTNKCRWSSKPLFLQICFSVFPWSHIYSFFHFHFLTFHSIFHLGHYEIWREFNVPTLTVVLETPRRRSETRHNLHDSSQCVSSHSAFKHFVAFQSFTSTLLFDSIRFSSKCFKIKALLEDEEEFRNDPWIDENKKLKMWCQNKNLTETVTEI